MKIKIKELKQLIKETIETSYPRKWAEDNENDLEDDDIFDPKLSEDDIEFSDGGGGDDAHSTTMADASAEQNLTDYEEAVQSAEESFENHFVHLIKHGKQTFIRDDILEAIEEMTYNYDILDEEQMIEIATTVLKNLAKQYKINKI